MGASPPLVILLRVMAEDFREWVPMMAVAGPQTTTMQNTTTPDRGVEGQHQLLMAMMTEKEGRQGG
jgi:hypothetical protein